MKKNRDFFEDEIPFFEFERDGQSLPDIFMGESEGERQGKRESRTLAVLQFILPFLIMITSAVLIFVIVLIATGNGSVGESLPVAYDDGVAEWRGAFDSRAIYERSVECSVSLKVGSGESERKWSGVIISSDGWIATSKNMVNGNTLGRIYVTLSDGREYGVGSLFQSDAGAALKIDAEGLTAAELAEDRELQCGESVIAVSSGSEVVCGSVASVGESLKFSLPYSDASEGSPVFDSEGRLVGMIEDRADATQKGAVFGVDAEKIEDLVEIIKNK